MEIDEKPQVAVAEPVEDGVRVCGQDRLRMRQRADGGHPGGGTSARETGPLGKGNPVAAVSGRVAAVSACEADADSALVTLPGADGLPGTQAERRRAIRGYDTLAGRSQGYPGDAAASTTVPRCGTAASAGPAGAMASARPPTTTPMIVNSFTGHHHR